MTPSDLKDSCLNRLEELGFQKGQFVIVVGAGASIPLIPDGKSLREEMAMACNISDDPGQPYWEFFEQAMVTCQHGFCRVIDECICDAPMWYGEVYEHIVKIPAKAIVTLNYDQFLPKAFGRLHGDGWNKRFSVYPLADNLGVAWPSDFSHEAQLVAIHGYRPTKLPPSKTGAPTWPIDRIILTASQFKKYYFSPDRDHILSHWWRALLTTYDCMFVCTSLQEPGIAAAVNHLKETNHPAFKNNARIHLQPARIEEMRTATGKTYRYAPPYQPFDGIEPLQFDPKPDYSGLLDILAPFSGIEPVGSLEPGYEPPKPHPKFPIS